MNDETIIQVEKGSCDCCYEENIEINLTEQQIMFGNKRIQFEIDPFKKECLLNGSDDIALSLKQSEKISSYENKLKQNKPWLN